MAKKTTKPKGTILRDGRLKYHAAESSTVVAVTPNGTFKLFKIMFGRDGSIYLPFPYLDAKRGLLSEADPKTEPDPSTINLRRNGILVEYDVKFSHHTSGIVQFSKTGDKALLPRRQGFRLDGPIGRVFDFQLHGLHGFEMVGGSKPQRDSHIALRFPHRHPTSLRVWGEWRRRSDILANTDSATASFGPFSVATRRSDGTDVPFLFLGQPKDRPLQDHLLLLSAEEIPRPKGADSPISIFMGGWDAHEGAPPQTPKMLVFMYPYTGDATPSPPTP